MRLVVLFPCALVYSLSVSSCTVLYGFQPGCVAITIAKSLTCSHTDHERGAQTIDHGSLQLSDGHRGEIEMVQDCAALGTVRERFDHAHRKCCVRGRVQGVGRRV